MTESSRATVQVHAFIQGQRKLLADVRFENGQVTMSGDQKFIDGLQDGVLHPLEKKIYTSADGMDFLNALTVVYDNPYLFATWAEE